MATIKLKRGTRAQLDAAALASNLVVGEPYLIIDEGRLAVGVAIDGYMAMELEGAKSASNIDGGNAGSVYLPIQFIDGGNAGSVYLPIQFIDGGTANG